MALKDIRKYTRAALLAATCLTATPAAAQDASVEERLFDYLRAAHRIDAAGADPPFLRAPALADDDTS